MRLSTPLKQQVCTLSTPSTISNTIGKVTYSLGIGVPTDPTNTSRLVYASASPTASINNATVTVANWVFASTTSLYSVTWGNVPVPQAYDTYYSNYTQGIGESLAYNTLFLIHPALDVTQCLTYTPPVNVTNASRYSVLSSGGQMQVLPCVYSATGNSGLRSQMWRVLQLCGSDATDYVIQPWTGFEPVQQCMIVGPRNKVIQNYCGDFANTTYWTIPGKPTPSLVNCPPAVGAFNVVGGPTIATQILAQVESAMGCDSAAKNATCLQYNLLTVFVYNNNFNWMYYARGKRDAASSIATGLLRYAPASSISSTAQATLLQTFLDKKGTLGQNWTVWVKGLDVLMNTTVNFLQLPSWPLLAPMDSLVVGCGPNVRLPGGLPGRFLPTFATGLRRLALTGCYINGSLPLEWTQVVGIATTTYMHQYPVIMDLSRNLLSGVVPPAWFDWAQCHVSQISLANNKLNVAVTDVSLANQCSSDSNHCHFYNTYPTQFSYHVLYWTGSVPLTGVCGERSLGYAGISWDTNAQNLAFMFYYRFNIPAALNAGPNAGCAVDNSCDLEYDSFEVSAVTAFGIPYALILYSNANVNISGAGRRGWFALHDCGSSTMFGDNIRNVCKAWTPYPILYIVFAVICAAVIAVALWGWRVVHNKAVAKRQRSMACRSMSTTSYMNPTSKDDRTLGNPTLACGVDGTGGSISFGGVDPPFRHPRPQPGFVDPPREDYPSRSAVVLGKTNGRPVAESTSLQHLHPGASVLPEEGNRPTGVSHVGRHLAITEVVEGDGAAWDETRKTNSRLLQSPGVGDGRGRAVAEGIDRWDTAPMGSGARSADGATRAFSSPACLQPATSGAASPVMGVPVDRFSRFGASLRSLLDLPTGAEAPEPNASSPRSKDVLHAMVFHARNSTSLDPTPHVDVLNKRGLWGLCPPGWPGFRMHFLLQTGVGSYIIATTTMLVGTTYAQGRLCAATNLCPSLLMPLVLAFFLSPGFVEAILVTQLRVWNLGLQQNRALWRTFLRMLAWLPLSILLGIVWAPIAWLLIPFGWALLWWPFFERYYWIHMCLMGIMGAPFMSIPLGAVVTYLFVYGYNLGTARFNNNNFTFVLNIAGHGMSCVMFVLGWSGRRDAWRIPYRLLMGDENWHVYDERLYAQHAEFVRASSLADSKPTDGSIELHSLSTASATTLVGTPGEAPGCLPWGRKARGGFSRTRERLRGLPWGRMPTVPPACELVASCEPSTSGGGNSRSGVNGCNRISPSPGTKSPAEPRAGGGERVGGGV
ncbi:MAG: hypothetical protein WDW36_000460 [Sanguina aurantia]